LQEPLAYISGEYFPHSEAKISIFDAGLNLGFVVTESTRTFNHVPFKLDRHVARLYKSLKVCRLWPGMTQEQMLQVSLEVLERNKPCYAPEQDMWLVHNVTPGTYPMTGDMSKQAGACVMIFTLPLDLTYWAPFYTEGCHAVTPPSRMVPAESLDARIKNRSRMPYTLAELEVKLVDPMAQGIILDVNGYLAENKGGNFFIVADGVVKTPRTVNCLAGISRETVLELCESLGIPSQETDLLPYDVYTADEAFFTSTPYCIMPATKFNGLPVGDGQVGPVTKKLLAAWSEMVGLDIVKQAQEQ
jgi:branched-chain amino acid aminotransferase